MNIKKIKKQARDLIRGRILELIAPLVLLFIFSMMINWLIISNLPNAEQARALRSNTK